MSKRYREALEEVETPASRRRAATAAAGVGGAEVGGAGNEEPEAVPVDGDAPVAGVATLVRPRAETVTRQEPATASGSMPHDHEPLAFTWRGRRYVVTRVIGHWREEEGWWRRPDGEPIRIEQSDLWRVEATRATAADGRGVYELACRGGAWRLDRVWD